MPSSLTPEILYNLHYNQRPVRGNWVILKAGIHNFKSTIRIPSNITLCGEGVNTILFLDPASGMREAMINAEDNLHDITIRDLVIECATKTDPGTDPNSSRSYGEVTTAEEFYSDLMESV